MRTPPFAEPRRSPKSTYESIACSALYVREAWHARGDSMTERKRIGEGEASEAGPRGQSPASQTISPHA
eukprot:6790247-Prymnesium_polylepis.1